MLRMFLTVQTKTPVRRQDVVDIRLLTIDPLYFLIPY
jgi:hypothetical protein